VPINQALKSRMKQKRLCDPWFEKASCCSLSLEKLKKE